MTTLAYGLCCVVTITALLACTSASPSSQESASSSPPTTAQDRRTEAPFPMPTKRFQGTRQEMFARLTRCLGDKGFDVPEPPPGQYSFSMPPGADPVDFSWARFDCWNAVGDIPLPPLTDKNLRIMYETEIKAAECIRKFGVVVPEAPSYQKFADGWRSGEISWFARMNITERNPRYAEIMATCDNEALQSEPFEF